MASYDLFSYLIKTKNHKHQYPQNSLDWEFQRPEIPAEVYGESRKGKSIVIFTNIAGATKKEQDTLKEVNKNMAKRFKAGIQSYMATAQPFFLP